MSAKDYLYKIDDVDPKKDLKRKYNIKIAEMLVLSKKLDSLRKEIEK